MPKILRTFLYSMRMTSTTFFLLTLNEEVRNYDSRTRTRYCMKKL